MNLLGNLRRPGGIEYTRQTYGVPARRGARILFMQRDKGTILSSKNGRLHIKFDGIRRTAWLHPTWEVTYLPKDGKTT